MIETLPLLRPDAERSIRTIARCHERLACTRNRLKSADKPARLPYLAERALVLAFCVLYLSGVVAVAIQMLNEGMKPN